MYLTYSEYQKIGGTLEKSAFSYCEKRARYVINSQAGGQTGRRIIKFSELPEAVKDCTFELIDFLSSNNISGKQISSESQSQGGVSESCSYATKTDEEIADGCTNIIEQYFYGADLACLLYVGACE